MVYRPLEPVNGSPQTEVFMVTCIDVKGSVPKVLINNLSSSVPRENFAEFEAAAIAYSDGSFDRMYK
jgi:hypothetical protein